MLCGQLSDGHARCTVVVREQGEFQRHTITRAHAVTIFITPAGFDKFFRELAEANAQRPMSPPEVAEMAARYELPFAEPDWIGDVIERYGLTPPF